LATSCLEKEISYFSHHGTQIIAIRILNGNSLAGVSFGLWPLGTVVDKKKSNQNRPQRQFYDARIR
jgi:hypothetical protein